jgi:hypothetical protein
MVSREELERFLDHLSAEGVSYTEVAPGLWRVRPGGALDFDIAVTYAPPVVLLRANVTELPDDDGHCNKLTRRLLELNATDLLHGAYGIDRDTVVLSEALELGHLDYEEFRACFESMTIALGSHLRELVSIRDGQAHTGTHRAVSPDALHEAR